MVRCSGHYFWKIFLHPSIRSRCLQRIERKVEEGEEVADGEVVEEAFEIVVEGSEG